MTTHKAKVLVACELSGTVRDAFAARGFYAVSCDLMPSDKPGNHYQGDALNIINQGWDLIIAHPPCTYLSKAGARWLYQRGEVNQQRLEQGFAGKAFFDAMLNANCPRICVENPTPLKVFNLPPPPANYSTL